MRIAFVVRGGFDPSGRERVVPVLLAVVGELATRHDVHVFVLRYYRSPATYPLVGATIHDLGWPPHWLACWRTLAAAMRRAGRVDRIVGYCATPAGLAAALAGRTLGVPSIVTLDSGELVSLPDLAYGLQRTWRGRLAVRLACRLASRVTVCTAYMHELARLHGVDAAIVPFGIETRRFARVDAPPEGPPWRLLQVARLNPVKDQGTLLEALAILRRRGLEVTLDLVGEDTTGGAVAARAETLGLSGAVRLHGFRAHDELPACLAQAHLYVQSSRHEAAGVAVLEAAAAGVPVVGTAVGYVRDWDGTRAVAVPPGHPEALAVAIEAYLANPGERARRAAAARVWAIAHDAAWTARAVEALAVS
jgi:glycosyltransferase involved in cell wall biosynthesis